MANKNICNKLQQARKDAGLSQKDVYEWLGISQSTFSSWETGKSEPSLQIFLQLCVKYGIDDICDYFLSEKVHSRRILDSHMLTKLASLTERGRLAVYNCLDFEYGNMQREQPVVKRRLPIYMQPAAAGLGNYLSDEDYLLTEVDAPEEADAGIRISGDSMEPLIPDGEVVYVKFQPQLKADSIGIFILNGDAYCKRLEYRAGEAYLCSLNPKYSPIHITSGDDLRVIGKVLI